MYSIYLKAPREDPNSILIYDDLITDNEYLLIDPKLVKEDNSTGSLEFEVPLNNIGYSYITPYSKDMYIYVYKQGYQNTYGLDGTDDVYWAGRIIDVNRGIENHKNVYCEGVLGFLNDTIQTPGVYETETSDNDDWTKRSLHLYIGYLLETKHNPQVDLSRKIYLGETTATYEPTKWYTNFESTMDVIQDIASATGGHVRIRRSVRDGHSAWVLDLLNDDVWVLGETDSNGIVMTEENKWRYRWVPNNDQQIEYGVNLTDLDQAQSLSSIYTRVYSLGKRADESTIEGLDEYKTIDGCDTSKIPSAISSYISIGTDAQGYKYIQSSFADVVGDIATSVHYDDVDDPTELMLLGILSLTLPNSVYYEVEAEAIDASYRDHSLKPIDTYDIIEVVAMPHELVSYMKVSKSEIPLDNPVETTFTIGSTKIATFTGLSNQRNKNLNSEIKYLTVKPFNDPSLIENLEERVSKLESMER